MSRSIFAEEVSQRASIARNAKHRICGSKSKKCRMPTDGMTRRQWERMNGSVYTYRLTKPMTWAEFKAYPKDLQKQYLCGLVETYGANLTTLSAMFGASPATIRSFIDENNYGLSFGVGHKMTYKQRELWQKFLSGDEDKTECEVQKAETGSAELAENAPAENECNLPTMTMTQFSFTFQGKIDVSAIANSILQLIGENGCGKVEIVCTL